jgi:polar amino acid transport system substrate-binding protein
MINKFFFLSLILALLLYNPHKTLAAPWQEVKARGRLIVAVKDNLRPLGFRDEQGKLQGLEIELARRLAQELLGNPEAVEFVPVSNRERLETVIEDRVDLAIASVGVNASRRRLVDFSPHYYLDGTALVTLLPRMQRVENLATGKILVLNGSSNIAVIQSLLPKAQLQGIGSYGEALELLNEYKADALVADQSILTGWIQEHPQYHLLTLATTSGNPLAVVMPKGLQYGELRTRVNQAIDRLHQSGWLKERIAFWGLL